MTSLDGKVAIVTGGGRGIGREHALALAQHGARVVVNDRGGEWDGSGADPRAAQAVVEEIRSAGGQAVADHGDVSVTEDADRLVTTAVEAFGGLDILVNNAGILRDRMLVNMTDEEWDSVVRVHLRGHFAPTRAACRVWRETAKRTGAGVGARVICTSSESGLYGNAGQTNYAAAKAGIAAFGLAVAREMGRYGVTSNVIAPRARSRMMEKTFGEIEVTQGYDRWHPSNVSAVLCFLASDAAAHVSGQVFVVGGGVLQLVRGFEPVWDVQLEAPLDSSSVQSLLSDPLRTHGSLPGPVPDLGLVPS